MVEEGLGLDVAGGGEILAALKAGVDPRLVVLHGNAKLPEEIALAVEHDLGLVVVDGPDDVDRLEAAVPSGRVVDVLVRVIPGVTAETHDSVLTGHDDSKFGLAPADAQRPDPPDRGLEFAADARVAPARRLPDPARPSRSPTRSRRSRGWASSRSTTSAAAWVRATPGPTSRQPSRHTSTRCSRQPGAPARRGRAHRRAGPQHGGGGRLHGLLGRDREARQAHLRRRRRRHGRQPRGRPVRPAVRGRHPRPSRRVASPGAEVCQLVGRHCESGDVLVRDLALPRPAVGDLVVVPTTGAYCFTMANNYNGNRRPPVVFARDGMWRTVVRRETWDDLLRRDVDRADRRPVRARRRPAPASAGRSCWRWSSRRCAR